MHLKELKLFSFRNLADQTVSFAPSVNLVVGDNGQGKTNLIEAIYLLSLSRSFRTFSAKELVRWGEAGCSIFGTIEQRHSDLELGLAVRDGSREPFVNGEKISSLADFVGRLICVGFSPSDLEIVRGSPQIRRRFIDKHIVDLRPALFKRLMSYQRALKSKNALLKAGTQPSALDTWNMIMAEEAAAILNARHEAVRELEREADELHDTLSGARGRIGLRMRSGLKRSGDQYLRDEIFQQLQECRGREVAMRSARLGPHRDDLVIELTERDAGSYASQGQARSIVLSLKLAIVRILSERRGEAPVVLLDDVDSELDHYRSAALFELIEALNAQICVTGTRLASALESTKKEARVMRLEAGKVSL